VLGVKANPEVVVARADNKAAAKIKKVQRHYKWSQTLMLPYGQAVERFNPPW
jgi:hypothetical protein